MPNSAPVTKMRPKTYWGTWTAFLMMAFAVLGMVGAFAVFAAQIPYERAMARSDALDLAAIQLNAPNGDKQLKGLRLALGDSADRIVNQPAPVAITIARERTRMFDAFSNEAADIGTRLRVVIAVFTIACALFGAAVLSIVRRSR
jgi:hypothetical protein